MKLLITLELLPLRGSSRRTSLAGGAMFFSVDVVFSVFSVAVLVVGYRDPLPSSLASFLKDLGTRSSSPSTLRALGLGVTVGLVMWCGDGVFCCLGGTRSG